MRDMDSKGRRVNAQPRGSRNGNSKLTRVDVEWIRANGGKMPNAAIGRHVGVTGTQVKNIISRAQWPTDE